MTVTGTATMGLRLEDLDSLSGNRTLISGGHAGVNEIIPAVTNDQDESASMGNFSKSDLVGIAMRADQDGLVRIRGASPFVIQNIATLGDMATLVGGTFTVLADQTAWIYPGDIFYLEGCTTPANDGVYMVIDSTFAAGVTTIEVIRQFGAINGAVIEVFDTVEAGAGAACLARKVQALSPKHYIDAGDDFTVAGAPGQFEVAEDLSWLEQHDQILIQEATNPGNNDIFTVVSATFTPPDTTIIVEEAVVVEAGNANASLIQVRDEFFHRLEANIPTVWHNESGIPNPMLEDITQLLISNSHATADMDFELLLLKVPV